MFPQYMYQRYTFEMNTIVLDGEYNELTKEMW
jgi:hypothetical protein